MPGELQLSFLGKPKFERDGEPLTGLVSIKGQALLAYLAVTGQAHSRQALAGLLWPEMPEKRARTNLRVTLGRVRKSIGDYLLATRRTVAFNQARPYRLDVAILKQACEAADAKGRTRDTLRSALRLYRGDFLDDFHVPEAIEFEEWVVVEREHLRRLTLNALHQLVQEAQEQELWEEGIEDAGRILTLDSWREEAHRQLMRLLARSGQRGAALAQYGICRRILAEALGVEPAEATTALYEQIRSGELGGGAAGQKLRGKISPAPPLPRSPAPPHNLPAQPTPFIGREEEQAEIAGLLADPGCRLLTLVGPGGIGKTRLALQVAAQFAGVQQTALQQTVKTQSAAPTGADEGKIAFDDGVYAIFLAPVGAGATNTESQVGAATASALNPVASAIGEAIGLPFSGKDWPEVQLLDYLKQKKMLLVLDNFEHLIDHANLLSAILAQVPGVKLMVTSRESLNLYEEWLFDIKGLSYPQDEVADDPACLDAYSGVQLFVQRARRVDLRFSLETQKEAVLRICQLVEGTPLGIELAAAWVRTIPCHEIATEIERTLDFLTTRVRNVPQRQRSLRAAFDHSWRLLAGPEKEVFKSISVFRGGFSYRAALPVANAERHILLHLVDKSILYKTPGGRYQVHELLRQYAAGRQSTSEAQTAKDKHCHYFARFLRQGEKDIERAEEKTTLAQIRAEIENIRSSWQWVIANITPGTESDDSLALLGQMIPMTAYFYRRQGWYQEGRELFERAERAMVGAGWDEAGETASERQRQFVLAQVRLRQAILAFHLGAFETVKTLSARCLPVLQRGRHYQEQAEALANLGMAEVRLGANADSKAHLRESLRLYRHLDDQTGSTAPLNGLGIVACNQGDYQEGRKLFQQCLAIFEASGYQSGMANCLNNIGSTFSRQGEYEEARHLYQGSLALARAAEEPLKIAVALSNLGHSSNVLADYATARRYFEESLALSREIGEQRWTVASLNGLSETFIGLGHYGAAGDYLHEALTTAIAIRILPDAMDTLSIAAHLLMHEGALEQAATILGFVINHPACPEVVETRSQQRLAGIAKDLPATEIDRARQRGESLTLDEIVAAVLTFIPDPARNLAAGRGR